MEGVIGGEGGGELLARVRTRVCQPLAVGGPSALVRACLHAGRHQLEASSLF